MRNTKIIAGSSHPELAKLICDRLGVSQTPITTKKFSNKETGVDIGVSVRNEDVYIIQSGSAKTNDHVMELLIMISACKIASAKRITAILPYFPYCKQSKKKAYRSAITAKLIANMLAVAGVDHVITMDLHASQMQGFFNRPVDNLYAEPSIRKWIMSNVPEWERAVVVSKNAGGAKRVTSLADSLGLDFALIHKDRSRPHHINPHAAACHSQNGYSNVISRMEDDDDDDDDEDRHVRAMNMSVSSVSLNESHNGHYFDGYEDDRASVASTIPEEMSAAVSVVADDDGEESLITLVGDVRGRIAFLVDDMVDGCSSFLNAASHLMTKCGAKAVYIIATHGVLSGSSAREIQQCRHVHKLVVTNTYPIPKNKHDDCPKMEIIDISATLAEAIRRTHNGESISYLFRNADFS
ncbi:hypothetical protein BZG36_03919 [Bifiguratus adelaidae]|uniref:Ribose-phosphate pyrophosphokinase 1 n=1 Tax=Bifiguratus adelaidae TaxID=1938954 RepID=A0A261XZH4_9FUNG|nr:hypothetical protein BZG36_03919 [Bifiguratus adelaidae]